MSIENEAIKENIMRLLADKSRMEGQLEKYKDEVKEIRGAIADIDSEIMALSEQYEAK